MAGSECQGGCMEYVRGLIFNTFKQLPIRAPLVSKSSSSVIRKQELLIRHLLYYVLLIYNAFIFSVSFEHSLNSINSPRFSIWYNSTTWKRSLIYTTPSLFYILAFKLISSCFSSVISSMDFRPMSSGVFFIALIWASHTLSWLMDDVFMLSFFGWYLASLNWANK